MPDQLRALSDVGIDAVGGGIDHFHDLVVSSVFEPQDIIISSAVGAAGKSDDTDSRK